MFKRIALSACLALTILPPATAFAADHCIATQLIVEAAGKMSKAGEARTCVIGGETGIKIAQVADVVFGTKHEGGFGIVAMEIGDEVVIGFMTPGPDHAEVCDSRTITQAQWVEIVMTAKSRVGA